MDLLTELIKSTVADKEPKMKPGDYKNENGLIVCGTCGVPRQKELTYGEKKTVVRCMCQCDIKAMEVKKEQEANREEANRIRRLRNTSLMDSKYHDATFENYEVDKDNEKAYKVAKNYVAKFDMMLSNNQGLLFHGSVGTGKTYTAACIANELLQSNVSVIMTSFVKILQEVQNPGTDEAQYITKINSAKLLIIDDLGTERNTDFALEKVYNIIDSRTRSAKPIILTTNLSWDEITKEEDIRYKRIFDRILEVCYPVNVPGKSRRIKEAKKRFENIKKELEG